MSEIIENAKTTIEECCVSLAKFNRIKAQEWIKSIDAEAQLPELEEQLSQKLTAFVLNEADKEEVAKIKAEIADSKEIIADTQLILKGLVAREAIERAKWRKAQKVLFEFEKYHTLKEQTNLEALQSEKAEAVQ